MNVRPISSSRLNRYAEVAPRPKTKRRFLSVISLVLIFFGLFFIGHYHGTAHAASNGNIIKSGYSGYCLDNHTSADTPGNPVDIWGCNNTDAQSWDVSFTQIKKSDKLCLEANSISSITINYCSENPKEIWLEYGNELYSPHFGLCLTASGDYDGATLTLARCHQAGSTLAQSFTPTINLENVPCSGSQGQMVACYAVKEWINWQANPTERTSYLTNYTDGAAYEQWCADFISYLYKEAGYPFSNGDPGWDENVAADIQNQGFTKHAAGSYIPQVGDVGFFNYPGGHVEVVIAGGPHPTFIYGDSGTKDPIINNGAMASNDILSRKNIGSVQYYLSPNSST